MSSVCWLTDNYVYQRLEADQAARQDSLEILVGAKQITHGTSPRLKKQEHIRSIDAGILRTKRKLYLNGLYLLPNPKNKCI